jgi:hypothetical protein
MERWRVANQNGFKPGNKEATIAEQSTVDPLNQESESGVSARVLRRTAYRHGGRPDGETILADDAATGIASKSGRSVPRFRSGLKLHQSCQEREQKPAWIGGVIAARDGCRGHFGIPSQRSHAAQRNLRIGSISSV